MVRSLSRYVCRGLFFPRVARALLTLSGGWIVVAIFACYLCVLLFLYALCALGAGRLRSASVAVPAVGYGFSITVIDTALRDAGMAHLKRYVVRCWVPFSLPLSPLLLSFDCGVCCLSSCLLPLLMRLSSLRCSLAVITALLPWHDRRGGNAPSKADIAGSL